MSPLTSNSPVMRCSRGSAAFRVSTGGLAKLPDPGIVDLAINEQIGAHRLPIGNIDR